jgi:hypothetical protein
VDIAIQIFVALVVGGVGGGVASWLAFRIKFEKFLSMDQERELTRKENREVVNVRLNSHAADLKFMSSHGHRLETVKHDLDVLRHAVDENETAFTEWRHKIHQPQMSELQRDVYRLQEKVQQLERVRNGKQ